MARLRIDEPDRLGLRLESLQHRNQLPPRNCGIGEIVLQLCESVTGASGVTDCRTVAETHIAFGTDDFFVAALHETPWPGETCFAKRKRDAVVIGQILDPLRFAEF